MDYETKENIIEIGWWATLWLVIAVVILVVAGAITADHRVRRYYVGHTTTPNLDSCVRGDVPWEVDDIAFCSTDPQKTLEFARTANEQLARTK